jgi:hypothetical protein
MGATSSIESSYTAKYVQPLVFEYQSSKSVMEPKRARKNMLEFLTSGKYPFSDAQISTIRSAHESCENEISNLENEFHHKWEEIVDEGGSAYRTHTQNTSLGGGGMDLLGGGAGGGLLDMLGGGGLGMGLDSQPEQQQESTGEAEEPAAVDEQQASQEISSICQTLLFTNQLPRYIERVSGGYAGIQIGLKMSDRMKLLDAYARGAADLLRACEEAEARSRDAVAACLQGLLTSLAKKKQEEVGEGEGEAGVVSTDITWGVSLKFLKEFLQAHPEIDDNYSTGSVVYNIIIPETAASQETYVKARLLGQQSQLQHISDLREGFRRVVVPRQQRDMGLEADEVSMWPASVCVNVASIVLLLG